jgi:hypothetical protein
MVASKRDPAANQTGGIGGKRRSSASTLAACIAVTLLATGCAHRRHPLAHHHGIIDRGPTGPSAHGDDKFHDSCLALVNVGDASSVPRLIRALSFLPDVEIKGTRMGIICTQAHCVAALERITGVKVGVSYSSWKRWWDETHPGHPIKPAPGYRGNQPKLQLEANDGPATYYRSPIPTVLEPPEPAGNLPNK